MKRETKILKADHNPIEVGDNVLVDVKTKTKKHKNPTGPGPDVISPPKPPAWFAGAIQEALSPIRSDIKAINTRLNNIDTRLDRLEDFNNDQKFLNKKFTDYIESHS